MKRNVPLHHTWNNCFIEIGVMTPGSGIRIISWFIANRYWLGEVTPHKTPPFSPVNYKWVRPHQETPATPLFVAFTRSSSLLHYTIPSAKYQSATAKWTGGMGSLRRMANAWGSKGFLRKMDYSHHSHP